MEKLELTQIKGKKKNNNNRIKALMSLHSIF